MSNQIQVEVQDIYGNDRKVAEAAWTSSLTSIGKDKKSDADVARVCKMVTDDGHGTPIESIIFRFWIRMPIATDRQHMTHRIGSHNGMSGRYRTMPTDYFEMPEDITEIFYRMQFDGEKYGDSESAAAYFQVCEEANEKYKKAVAYLKKAESLNIITNVELKRAREFIRGMLPQHNMTERITIMNLRSFANYIVHRASGHAQDEIRDVVTQLYAKIKQHENYSLIQQTWEGLERNYFRTTPLPDTDYLKFLRNEDYIGMLTGRCARLSVREMNEKC